MFLDAQTLDRANSGQATGSFNRMDELEQASAASPISVVLNYCLEFTEIDARFSACKR